MTRVRTWTLVMVAASGLGLAACASSSASPTTTTTASTTTSTGASSSTTVPLATISDPSAPGTFGTEPTITVPPGAPPTQLESKDLIVGTGATAEAGETVTVQYVGVAYSNGKVFDASWNRDQPFQFALGEGQVITGWDQGVVGMKVGGRRELIIPPNLAYGANAPAGSGIAPNDTLIFIVDLLKVG
jgi:peptidylprolyl isomerase